MSHVYAGHVPSRVRDASLAYQPGTSREQADNKFHYPKVLAPAVLHSEETISIAAAASEKLNRQAFVKPELGPEIIYLPVDKECQLKSTVGMNHVNFDEERRIIADLTDEHIAAGFAAVDKKGEGVILPSEVRMAVREALRCSGYKGEPTVRHMKLLNGYLGGGWERRITLEEFGQTLRKIADYLERELACLHPKNVKNSVASANAHRFRQEVAKRAGILGAGGNGATLASPASPLGATASRSTVLEDNQAAAAPEAEDDDGDLGRPVSRGVHKKAPVGFHPVGFLTHSTYQLDVGGRDDPGPAGRPAMDSQGTGIWQTTRDLSAGTTKICKHTPSYSGHIPRSPTGERKFVGTDTREVQKVNLTETFHRRIPGYSGCIGDFVSGDPVTVRKAQGPAAATDYERNNHAITQYWEAKKQAGIKR